MKSITLWMGVFILLSGCAKKANPQVGLSERARAEFIKTGGKYAQKLVKTLKHELLTALETGDTLKAMQICNMKALPLTQSIIDSSNGIVDIRRVSFKNRNPQNYPDAVDSLVMQEFKNAEHEKSGIRFKLVQNNEKRGEYRYYQPLKMGKFCLSCHGKKISPPLKEKIGKLYPEDKATGYTTGELRGVICVTMQKKSN